MRTRWIKGLLMTGGACGSLLVAGSPLVRAAACDWTGAATTDRKWSTSANWSNCSGSYPTGDANLTVPVSGHNVCEYDSGAPTSVGIVTITGSSPTVFTLHVKDKDFQPSDLNLFDYSKLDIDQDLTMGAAHSTVMRGSVSIDVATGSSCVLQDGIVDGDEVNLSLVTASGTQVGFHTLELNAFGDAAIRRLKLIGGGRVDVDDLTSILGAPDPGASAYKAKLWVSNAVFTTENLDMQGGLAANRQVELDIDRDMTVDTGTWLGATLGTDISGGGWITIDVEDGKTLDVGELVIEAPCVLKVTGNTSASSPGQLTSSP